MGIISYPVPAYQNLPIESDFYSPRRFNISAISTGQTTTVTTTIDHDYVVGQLVRLIIPLGYGSRELNEKQGYIISLPAADQFTLDLESYNTTSFTNPGTGAGAQSLAIGDINSGVVNGGGLTNQTTYIPGSFINISPQ